MALISLIDGVWTILTSVSITLEAEEFKVETSNSGQSALDASDPHMSDQALFNIRMPRIDGVDHLRRLR